MPQGRVIVTTFPGWGVTITTNSLYMARDYRKIDGSMDLSQVSSHVLVLLSHELTLPVMPNGKAIVVARCDNYLHSS